MAFRPGTSTTAERGRIYAVSGQSLHVRRDEGAPQVPVGVPPQGALYLGDLEGEACFAIDAGDSRIEISIELGEPVALRQL
ncbi:MAG TPA: hypothetical protein VIV40_31020, partial [Kofleriaceae bacterium]